jgi:hypothetical protein
MSDKEAFNTALFDLYQRTKDETWYNPTIFFRMLCDRGGLQTAKDLLATPKPSEGYTKLWELGRLDLTVEALVINPRWQNLFTPDELATARKRLNQYGYTIPCSPA